MPGSAHVVTDELHMARLALSNGLAAMRHMLAATIHADPAAATGSEAASPPTRGRIAPVARGRTDEKAAEEPGTGGPETGGDDPVRGTEIWDLVRRAQAGDTEAFGQIYDRYIDTVFRYIYFRVSRRDLAEDLTSETFLRALKRINSFTWQGRDFGAWLVTIARNLMADHFKSGRYRLEVATADVLDADKEESGPEGNPETAVVDKITNATLLEAVKELNAEQQECIVLRFLQGFSVAETARAMNKNEGAIKALQYRAVRTLGRLLPEGFGR
ncbi:ECF subfamily RNA polymerase sigma factor, BldN family [Phytomonospora sp. NPDC050363]|uniref:ECF subfamily RNA polymerase sigma factor, BldN family n=1 Tax=Phytomonospora sp. NPDC050363 TaxID=3155642 RepID=UPI0033FF9950